MMKIKLVAVMVFTVIAGCAQVGRYQIAALGDTLFRLDTATGVVEDLGGSGTAAEASED